MLHQSCERGKHIPFISHTRSDGSRGIYISAELAGLVQTLKEVTLLLLQEVEGGAVLAEAGLDARLLILAEGAADLEVQAEVSAESVLSRDGRVVLPVFMILEEGALEDWVGHLNCSDGLKGVDFELVTWLSHIALSSLFNIIIRSD